jgi:hypothetical protein
MVKWDTTKEVVPLIFELSKKKRTTLSKAWVMIFESLKYTF